MEAVLLVSTDDRLLAVMRRSLPETSSSAVIRTPSAVASFQPLDPGLAIIDLGSSLRDNMNIVDAVRRHFPDCTLIALLPQHRGDGDEDLESRFYDCLRQPVEEAALARAVARALERGRLLRQSGAGQSPQPAVGREREAFPPPSAEAPRLSGILKELAKGPGAGLDLRRLVNFVHESVNELSPVTRSSIILGSPERGYRIQSSRGLQVGITDSIHLSPDNGLLLWLNRQGRVLRRAEADYPADQTMAQAAREMDMLQAVVSIPVVGHGRLLGSINLGDKAVGGSYADEELEMLYVLASNVAIAVENIDIFHELQLQKNYIEDILQRMNSGVITIDTTHRVTIFNHRAAEILGMNRVEALWQDLRVLPSPLGDMLHESLATGRKYDKHAVSMAGPTACHAEVSTFPLQEDGEDARGAVLIFDDISAEYDLACEREQRQRLELLNRVLALLAHELRNPMVSVNTFIELFPEKRGDDEFAADFYQTARRDVARLDDLLSKLITLSRDSDYAFHQADLAELLQERLRLAEGSAQESGVKLESRLPHVPLPVRIDRREMERAVDYILRNSINAVGGGIVTVEAEVQDGGGRVCVGISDEGEPLPESGMDYLFRPFYLNEGRAADIGLAVAQRIIEDHGGSLKSGEADGRAAFFVTLPVNDDREKASGDGHTGTESLVFPGGRTYTRRRKRSDKENGDG